MHLENTKKCPKCDVVMPLSMFNVDKHAKTGIRSHCKKCCAAYRKNYYRINAKHYITKTKEWRANNLDRSNTYIRDYNTRLRHKLIDGYGGKCTCCGETEFAFLTLEHLNGDGQEHRRRLKSWKTVYTEVINQNFPPQYTVLCMNCNCAKKNGHKCPHEIKRLLANIEEK